MYDAFGNIIATTGSGTPNNYLYCGQQWDPDLGVYYNRARYLNTDAGRFLSPDSTDGDQEDPLSLHKYLYGADNPVNRIDPSGYMSSLDAAKYGRMLHTKLGEDFVDKMEPFGVFGPSIATILKLPDTVTALFPDLVNINPANKEVYEIKPVGVGIAAGYLQLEGYLQVFNYFDPIKTWKPGSTYTPPLEVTLDPLTYALVSPPVRGVIIYELFSVKDFAKKRALNVAESESADIEDSVGISTLTTIIAF
jgi:RHS repeat-associated protein